ncbi:AAA family ATPase [Streptomyces silvensis]|uniref:Adenylyl-sulfate kinase n=1 Tax=Streptomyces silvensis TaxID=1765722 RepID=A0A0W7X969_9ACTN|nr:AAA family ATPase [Streptomyces silvensis]KUF19271.1 adenylyl-sulfate kinase [Streptomyces silvensis]
MLVVVGGLPATGKSTAARTVARRLGASYLRIDTIEQSLSRFSAYGADTAALRHAVDWGLGYEVAYATAGDLLGQGLCVFAECVNPMKVTRDAWEAVAKRAGARFVEVELICSDPVEHERRATSRTVDVPGLTLPTWQDIVERDYEPWDRDHIVVDTAGKSARDTVAELADALDIDG